MIDLTLSRTGDTWTGRLSIPNSPTWTGRTAGDVKADAWRYLDTIGVTPEFIGPVRKVEASEFCSCAERSEDPDILCGPYGEPIEQRSGSAGGPPAYRPQFRVADTTPPPTANRDLPTADGDDDREDVRGLSSGEGIMVNATLLAIGLILGALFYRIWANAHGGNC